VKYPSSWKIGENSGVFSLKENLNVVENADVVQLTFANYSLADLESRPNNVSYYPADYKGVELDIYYSELGLLQYNAKHYKSDTSERQNDGSLLLRNAQRTDPRFSASSVHILLKRGNYVYDFYILSSEEIPSLVDTMREMVKTLVPISVDR
jgi:hypothetical protein